MELISAIIVAYNVEGYIEKCLDSILNQTYKNLEIIIVNDGSTDKTGDLCKKYKLKDKRIKYIEHDKNYGQSCARNTGLDNATGDYIGFIDSDDYVIQDYFEVLHKNLLENDADISICNFEMVNANDNKDISNKIVEDALVKVYSKDERYYPFFNELAAQWLISWGRLYKRYIFINLRYIELQAHEDPNIAHKAVSKAEKVVYTDRIMYFYVQRKGSIMYTYTPKRLDILEGAYDRIIFFKNTLNNDNLYEIAVMSFWWHWINSIHLLETYVLETKGYKESLVKEYDIVEDVLQKVNKLEGQKEEYNEDFSKFINIQVPLEYVYRKINILPNIVDINVNYDKKVTLKMDYEINNKEKDIKIIRLFLEKGIANWEGKKGLEVSMKTSVPDKVIKLQIVDENNLVWFYNFKTNAGNLTTKEIQFTDFSIDETFQHVLKGDMALKRVKNLVFNWGTNLEKEKGTIEVYGIKVY